jgi:hypothetical protein
MKKEAFSCESERGNLQETAAPEGAEARYAAALLEVRADPSHPGLSCSVLLQAHVRLDHRFQKL